MRKFKYAPSAIPLLTEEQWEFLEIEMDKPMTEKEKEMWKKAEDVYETINANSRCVVSLNVDVRRAIFLLKILRYTCFFWFPFRKQVLKWLRNNLPRFVKVKVI